MLVGDERPFLLTVAVVLFFCNKLHNGTLSTRLAFDRRRVVKVLFELAEVSSKGVNTLQYLQRNILPIDDVFKSN